MDLAVVPADRRLVASPGLAAVLSASLYVRVRDVGEIWSPLARALFYASPTLIPIEFYPAQWHWILYFNPLAPLFAQARVWVIDPSAPTYAEAIGGWIYLLIPLVLLFALACGVFFFRRFAAAARRCSDEAVGCDRLWRGKISQDSYVDR